MVGLTQARSSLAAAWRAQIGARAASTAGLAVISLLGLLLRLYRLGAPSLTGDEALSAIFYSRPLDQLFPTLVTRDLHPPLYPLLLDGWMRLFGDGEVALRLPSVVFGTLLIPATYLAARTFWPDERDTTAVGLLAAGLTALSPVQLNYSQQARNYIVVTLLALLSSTALFAALRRGRARDWLLYGLATAAAFYAHYNAFFILPAQVAVVGLFAFRYRRRLVGFTLALVGALLVFAPWAYFMVRQLLRISDYLPIPHSIEDMGRAVLVELVTGFAGGGLGALLVPLIVLTLGLGALGVLSVVRAANTDGRAATVYLLLSVVLPAAMILGIWTIVPKYGARYLVIVAPPLTLLIARGLVFLLALPVRRGALKPLGLSGRSVGAVLAVAALGGSALAVRDSFAAPPYQDYRGLVETIAAAAGPNDAIALMPYADQPIEYYFRGGPRLPVYSVHFEENFKAATDRVAEIASKHDRLWLVSYFDDWTDPARVVQHALDERAVSPPEARDFGTIRLTLYRFDPARRALRDPIIEHATEVRFENGAIFKGWSVVRAPYHAGEPSKLDLHWQLERPVAANFKVVALIEDASGREVARLDQTPVVPLYAPRRWQVGTLMHGPIPFTLPAATPPGAYRVRLFIYDEASGRELGVLGPEGRVVGTRAEIGELPVARTTRPAAAEAVAIDRRLDPPATFSAPTGGSIELLGGTLPRTAALEGDRVEIALLWRAPAAPGRDLSAVVQGIGADGRTLLDISLPPVADLPTGQWRAGDVFLGAHQLRLPPDVPGGALRLRVGLRDAAGDWWSAAGAADGRFVDLGEIAIRERTARRTVPPMTHEVGARFGDSVQLLGYDLDAADARPGGALRLTLYWQALGTIDRNYKVFNHVVGADGRPVAQQDAEPLDGAVKMVVWKPGEVVTDLHVISIPAGTAPGEYGLRVGLYDPGTGARLGVSSGGDSARLTAVRIGSG